MQKRYWFFISLLILLFSQVAFAADIKTPAEINALYYNLGQSKLQSFKCQVTVDAFDKIKDRLYPGLTGDERKELDNVQFDLTYENGNLNFEASSYPKFQNDSTTQSMKKVIDGINLMVTGTFTSWKGIIAEPLIAGNEKYRIAKNNGGYRATYQQTGNDVEIMFNQDYVVEKATYRTGNQTMVLLPEFLPTPEGLLITKMDLNIGNGQIREVIALDYQEFNGIPLPVNINIQLTMGQVKQDVKLQCSNYQVDVAQ